MSDLGLQHYIETGELPDDPAVLAKLYEEATTGEAVSGKQDEEVDETSSAASGATDEKDPAGSNENGDKAPDGILSKNGKHVIPYDVLETERQRAAEAQRKADQLQAEIDRLKNNPNGATQADLPVFNRMSEEQLEELREYFPDQYEAIVQQQAAILAASSKLSTYEQQEADRAAEAQAEAGRAAQREIDNNPLLSHWQRNNPEIFQECVAMDQRLMANPATSNLSLTERFTKVANAMKEIYGNPVADAEQVQDISKGQAEKTETKPRPPFNSLSDIPGGEPAEASERQRLEDSDTAEIGARFMSMTEEQRMAYLNSLG